MNTSFRITVRALSCSIFTLMLAVTLIAASSGPANAGTTWKKGLHVTHSYHWDNPHADSWGGGDCWGGGLDSWADVHKKGDYTYVRDMCKDGKSAVVMVYVYDSDGSVKSRKVCRNPYGVKQWAKCDWNWSENGQKELVAGTYDADTGKTDWDPVRGVPFWD